MTLGKAEVNCTGLIKLKTPAQWDGRSLRFWHTKHLAELCLAAQHLITCSVAEEQPNQVLN